MPGSDPERLREEPRVTAKIVPVAGFQGAIKNTINQKEIKFFPHILAVSRRVGQENASIAIKALLTTAFLAETAVEGSKAISSITSLPSLTSLHPLVETFSTWAENPTAIAATALIAAIYLGRDTYQQRLKNIATSNAFRTYIHHSLSAVKRTDRSRTRARPVIEHTEEFENTRDNETIEEIIEEREESSG